MIYIMVANNPIIQTIDTLQRDNVKCSSILKQVVDVTNTKALRNDISKQMNKIFNFSQPFYFVDM